MKKIRLRFFLISAASLFIVLFGIIAGLNIYNKVNLDKNSSETCQVILNYGVGEPVPEEPIPGPHDPEIIFRSRYFIATYENDVLIKLDASRVIRITPMEAAELSNAVFTTSSLEGYSGIYYYKKSTDANTMRIIFLDRQVEIDTFNQTLAMSSIIASCGYVVVLVLIAILSSFIIKPIEIANSKQKRFITDASHELKTPLTIINSDISLIEMENGKSEWTDSIKKQTERLSKMTNELVLLSKLNEDDIRMNKIDINLGALINDSCTNYISILHEKGVNLSIDLASDIVINGDANLLGQLVNTLLDNMYKYATKGNALVSLRKNKKNIELLFVNNIDENSNIDVVAIFDRFYKADLSRSNVSNSFGIGLSMAKAIVELHSGKISASINKNSIIFKITF